MKKVIVVTGASSGFGALASRALASAGHTVYAGMRDMEGSSAHQVVLLMSMPRSTVLIRASSSLTLSRTYPSTLASAESSPRAGASTSSSTMPAIWLSDRRRRLRQSSSLSSMT
jgi:NAD(P)-dependent dehydrogenase (short-subunit alcohol dehydrogenase family)